MEPVKAVLVGAGARGMDVYAAYALAHPDEIRFVAVAEPNGEKRRRFCSLHGIGPDGAFAGYEELFAAGKLADCALVCTQDRLHTAPTLAALGLGYHVLLEKPMATTKEECLQLAEAAQTHGRHLMLCHVLRYTRFYSVIKQMLDEGQLGEIIGIRQNEDIGFWHFAHSYVRGQWRREAEASPMILAKCCHDLDILLWLAGGRCQKVYSAGGLHAFTAANAPKGAPARCMDGCPHSRSCAYYAPALYLTENTDWPAAVIADDMSLEAREQALRTGPYGRCVYHCDNDVCDYQTVNLGFESGVQATLTASAFSAGITRRIEIDGTKGRLCGMLDAGTVQTEDFASGITNTLRLGQEADSLGHGGGDQRLMADFVDLVREGRAEAKTTAQVSLASHLAAFAAEQARKTGQTVFL